MSKKWLFLLLVELCYFSGNNHGRLDFEIISKKSFFSILRGKKQISPLFAPPGKNLSDTHGNNHSLKALHFINSENV